MTAILFVCTGNICRSPTAEGVMRAKLETAGLGAGIHVDSAGISSYHVGEAPDRRSQLHARRRGYDLSDQRARRLVAEDFERFDYLLAMDRSHLAAMESMAPARRRGRVMLLLEFAAGTPTREVPDPYYGGDNGFEQVLDLIEAACDGLIAELGSRRQAVTDRRGA
jgi:protein-tyrosine phosphatase